MQTNQIVQNCALLQLYHHALNSTIIFEDELLLLRKGSKGSPHKNVATSIWALPVWGGGVSTLARMVWGTYLEKNCPSSNGHLLDCGGVKMLARMVWGTYAVKIEVQMGICLC